MHQLEMAATSAYVKTQQAVTNQVDHLLAGMRNPAERDKAFYGWIFIIGILIVAAAVAWVYCRMNGYRGFRGGLSVKRGPWGIVLGTYLECY